MDNLLRLIEKGDLDAILSDDELLPKLNELMKYELVVIKGETVILSEKGQEAKNIGVDETLKKAKSKNTSQRKDFRNYERPRKNIWLLGFLVLLIIIILLFLLPT